MLLSKDDFQKGQAVALKHSGNKARYDKGYTLGEVVSAGNKLITVSINGSKGIKFELEEKYERDYLLQRSNTVGSYELFPSEQAYLDYHEKEKKIIEIKAAIPSFGECKLSVDQVRRIYDIFKESE
jgi:hypothetical protein